MIVAIIIIDNSIYSYHSETAYNDHPGSLNIIQGFNHFGTCSSDGHYIEGWSYYKWPLSNSNTGAVFSYHHLPSTGQAD